jgi:Pyruvate/2-oxoacid:ferredoxin oxidoreductase delta subunit
MTIANPSVQDITRAIVEALTRYAVPLSGVVEETGCADCHICAQKCPEHVRRMIDAGAGGPQGGPRGAGVAQ